MYRVSIWVLLGVIAAAMFGWILRGGNLDGPRVAGWTDLGTWGWTTEGGMTTTAGVDTPAPAAKPADKTVAEKPAATKEDKKVAAADPKADKDWAVDGTAKTAKPAEAPAKEAAKPAPAPAAEAPKASDAWDIAEDIKKGVDVEIKVPGWKVDEAAKPAPEAKKAAETSKGIAHDRPWPIATEVPNWGKVMKVPAPAAESAKKAEEWKTDEPMQAAAGKGVAHDRPWPIATEVPNWGKVMKAPAAEAPKADDWATDAPKQAAAPAASVTAKAIEWMIADAPVKWDNVRIAAPAPEPKAAPAPAAAKAIEWPIAGESVTWDNVRIAAVEPEPEPVVTAPAIDWPIADAPVTWGNVRMAAPEPELIPDDFLPARSEPRIDWPVAEESVTWDNVRIATVEPEPERNATEPHPFPWPIATEVPKWSVAATPPPAPPAEVERRKEMTEEQIACEDELRRIYASGTILFKTDSAQLDTKSAETLKALAGAAKQCAKVRIRIEGHTDNVGSAAYNKKLSERRAKAIADYLKGAGVDTGMLTAQGYGLERPVAPNDNDANRQKNRRIEFTVY
jgi:outer membrane protein OmpA-like peptidoglycan-associated protein